MTGRAPLPYPMPVPTALLTGWAQTLDRLGQPAQDALLDLAVSGGRLDLLTAMAESGQALAEGLDEAEQSGVLVLGTPGHAAFRTATVRDVVLARAPAGQRRRAHRRAAEAALRLDLAPSIIVDHLALSVITADDSTAAEIAAQAERAERAEHYAAAARAWEAAAHMTTVPSDRVAFALSAIRVSFDMGLPASEDLLEIVSEDCLGSPVSRARRGHPGRAAGGPRPRRGIARHPGTGRTCRDGLTRADADPAARCRRHRPADR